MRKISVLQKLNRNGIVAVIRGSSKENAMEIAESCISGGIYSIEIAYTTPQATEVIREISDRYFDDSNVVIGAGTVLDSVTARLAIDSGSQFVVSPSFDHTVAEMCNLYRIPYMPGCITVSEMQEALKHGVDVIKLFPGDSLEPSYIKAVKAPLPQLNIMPTGGVNLENLDEWFKNGAFAVGVGGSLTKAYNDGNLVQTARQYAEKVKQLKTQETSCVPS